MSTRQFVKFNTKTTEWHDNYYVILGCVAPSKYRLKIQRFPGKREREKKKTNLKSKSLVYIEKRLLIQIFCFYKKNLKKLKNQKKNSLHMQRNVLQ